MSEHGKKPTSSASVPSAAATAPLVKDNPAANVVNRRSNIGDTTTTKSNNSNAVATYSNAVSSGGGPSNARTLSYVDYLNSHKHLAERNQQMFRSSNSGSGVYAKLHYRQRREYIAPRYNLYDQFVEAQFEELLSEIFGTFVPLNLMNNRVYAQTLTLMISIVKRFYDEDTSGILDENSREDDDGPHGSTTDGKFTTVNKNRKRGHTDKKYTSLCPNSSISEHVCLAAGRLNLKTKDESVTFCRECIHVRAVSWFAKNGNRFRNIPMCQYEYTYAQFGASLIGIINYHVKITSPLVIKYEDAVMYHTEAAVKHAIYMVRTTFTNLYEGIAYGEKDPLDLTSTTDILLRSSHITDPKQFALHVHLSMLSAFQTMYYAGMMDITVVSTRSNGSDFSHSTNYSFTHNVTPMISYVADNLMLTSLKFKMDEKVINKYARLNVDFSKYIPCLLINIKGSTHISHEVLQKHVVTTLNNLYQYVLTRSSRDDEFVRRYDLSSVNLTDLPFAKNGTLKPLGDGHSLGFGLLNDDGRLEAYPLDAKSLDVLTHSKLFFMMHAYCMQALKSIIHAEEDISIAYNYRMADKAMMCIIHKVTLRPNVVDTYVVSDSTSTTTFKANPSSDTAVYDACAFQSWGELCSDENDVPKVEHALQHMHISDNLRTRTSTFILEVDRDMPQFSGFNALNNLDYTRSLSMIHNRRVSNSQRNTQRKNNIPQHRTPDALNLGDFVQLGSRESKYGNRRKKY